MQQRFFYCISYCLLNMFRAPLCPSSGAQEYYTVVAACGAVVFKLLVWCGAEGYVSGLQDACLYMDNCPALQRIALNISLAKQQHVTHAIRQSEIPDLLGSRVTGTPSVKMPWGQKTACPHTFVKTQHAEVLFCWHSVQLFLSAVKLCVGGLRQIAVS